jgi:glutaminyl-tRNA synthetase
MMEIENNPEQPETGNREVPFSGELYIEREDFMEEPPKKFFRLGPGLEVRLKGAYIIQCESFEKDPQTGEITEIRCTYDPTTRSGQDTSGKKVKGTIHWVSVPHAAQAEVRLYDRLFTVENPMADEEKEYTHFLNPESLVTVQAYIEPALAQAQPMDKFQFIRNGYFCLDKESTPDHLVFNRTVTLKDTWAKAQNG